MKNYIGRKINTAIFISGTGSNMRNLIKFSNANKSPINVKLVISSNKNAKGIVYASKKKIDNYSFKFSDLKYAEKNIFKILGEKKIKLICLAGFMKILSHNFIKKFKGKIINIHPSLLPKYKGLNTYKRVLKNVEKYTGCVWVCERKATHVLRVMLNTTIQLDSSIMYSVFCPLSLTLL